MENSCGSIFCPPPVKFDMLDAVFMDLDDTIVDYRYPVIVGLAQVRREVPALSNVDLGTMELEFREILRDDLQTLLDGRITAEDERISRLKKIIMKHGGDITQEDAIHLDELFMDGFWTTRTVIDGAIDLLKAFQAFDLPVIVITNGNDKTQRTTIEKLILQRYVKLLLTPNSYSEMKPSARLFQLGLQLTGANKGKTIMIGDAWYQDIQGAINAGIIPVWLNRQRFPRPEQREAFEVNSLTEILDLFE